MKIKIIISFFIVLQLACLQDNNAFAQSVRLTRNNVVDMEPVIYENKVLWVTGDHENQKFPTRLVLWDGVNYNEIIPEKQASSVLNPVISGKYLAWRNRPINSENKYSSISCLENEKELELMALGQHEHLQAAGDYLAWLTRYPEKNYSSLYIYNGELEEFSFSSISLLRWPVLTEDLLVFMVEGEDSTSVIVYDFNDFKVIYKHPNQQDNRGRTWAYKNQVIFSVPENMDKKYYHYKEGSMNEIQGPFCNPLSIDIKDDYVVIQTISCTGIFSVYLYYNNIIYYFTQHPYFNEIINPLPIEVNFSFWIYHQNPDSFAWGYYDGKSITKISSGYGLWGTHTYNDGLYSSILRSWGKAVVWVAFDRTWRQGRDSRNYEIFYYHPDTTFKVDFKEKLTAYYKGTNKIQVKIEADKFTILHLALHDISGKLIHSTSRSLMIGPNEIEINTGSIKPGIYILQGYYNSSNQRHVVKVPVIK